MNTQKIGEAVERALAYHDRIAITEDVWAAEDALADYLESVEKNLNDEEYFYFDEIFETMKKLRDAVIEFVNEAWVGIMYEERKGKLCLFENGHVGSERDVYAHGTQSLYTITLDWNEREHSALANEDDVKAELEEHLLKLEVVLNDYSEMWLEHIKDMYTRP